MDDRTAPSVHVRHNFEGLVTAFPPSYLLTRQASIDDPPAWSAVQETDAAGHTLIFAFQNDPEVEHTILKPRSLTPDAIYDVRSVDVGRIGSASGADLMENGIEVVKTPKSAAHVLVITEQRR
jgi:glycosyl hydrolase family 36